MKTSSVLLAIISVVLFSSCAVQMGCPSNNISSKYRRYHFSSYNNDHLNAPALNKAAQSVAVVSIETEGTGN